MEHRYELLKFEECGDSVRAVFMRNWYFDIPKTTLDALGTWSIHDNILTLPEDATSAFQRFIEDGLNGLTNAVSGIPTVYIHSGSGIPLIGNPAFGIVDRGTSLIEIKPLTSCNLVCRFCSVSEGGSAKQADFLVEADYLTATLTEVLAEKGLTQHQDAVEIHISCHGEPLLYGDLHHLIRGIRKLPAVQQVSMNTNGVLLTEELVDSLADAGLTRINLSLHTIDETEAKRLCGRPVDVDRLIAIARYIAHRPDIDLLLASVWIPGVNDAGIRSVISLGKELDVTLGIQNYLNYKGGRFVQKQVDWDTFRKNLEHLEAEFNVPLIMNMPKDFKIRKVKQIAKPFKKDQTVDARIVCRGHNPGEMVAAAMERCITIPNCTRRIGEKVRVKITGDKHNIFYGKA